MGYKHLVLLGILASAGCGGGGGGGNNIPGGPEAGDPNRYYVRSVHALSDGPSIRVTGDGRNWGRGLPYTTVAGLISQDLGNATSATVGVVVESQDVDGDVLDILLGEAVQVEGDTEVSIVVGGSYTDPFLMPVSAVRRAKPVANLYFQFAHAAPELGPVDIYVTAPGVDLATTAPFGSLAPFESTASLEIPYDETVIRLTTADTLDVVFNSQTFNFEDDTDDDEDGAEWFMAIAPNLIAGSSAFKLISGDGRSSFELYDRDLPASVRVIHASPDGPAMDVIIADNFDMPIANAMTYGERSAVGPVRGNRASLNFTEPGMPDVYLYQDTIESVAGFESTLFLAGEFDDLASADTPASPRSVFTQARVRFVNITTDDDFITVYLPEIADAGSDRSLIDDLPPTAATDYTPFDPGVYELRITKKTLDFDDNPNDVDEVPVFGPEQVSLGGGSVTTVVVFPPANEGEPEVVRVYDDLEP
jgi:hypothetical protein